MVVSTAASVITSVSFPNEDQPFLRFREIRSLGHPREGKGEGAIEPHVADRSPGLAIVSHDRSVESAQIVWIAVASICDCTGRGRFQCLFGNAIEHR